MHHKKILKILDLTETEADETAYPEQDAFIGFIQKRDAKKLKDLLDSFSSVNLEKILEGLLLAANIDAWSCIPVLMNYAKSLKTDDKNNRIFKAELGHVLLIAARKNHLETVREVFSYCPNCETRVFFYSYRDAKHKKQQALLADHYNGNTSLHWAVENNNPAMCEAILEQWNNDNIQRVKNYSRWFEIDCYADLCRAENLSGVSPYSRAILLGNNTCAQSIARYFDWFQVQILHPDVVLKTMLLDIGFGYFNFKDILLENFSPNAPYKISYINKHGKRWLTDENREKYYNISLTLPDEQRLKFITQATKPETALGSLFAANDPYNGNDIKNKLKEDLIKVKEAIKGKAENEKVAIEAIPDKAAENNNASADEHSHSESSYQDSNDERSEESSVESASESINLDFYSPHLGVYLGGFKDNMKINYRIKRLNLSPEEEIFFKPFEDPTTNEYIGIPVSVYERYYDFETLRKGIKDPYTNERFCPRDIQSGRTLMSEFDEAVRRLLSAREQKKAPVSLISSFSGLRFYSSDESSVSPPQFEQKYDDDFERQFLLS